MNDGFDGKGPVHSYYRARLAIIHLDATSNILVAGLREELAHFAKMNANFEIRPAADAVRELRVFCAWLNANSHGVDIN